MKLHILIVDDSKGYREALREMLAEDPNIEIVAEAGDGVAGLARAIETTPEVVCMDITLPRMNGIQATRRMVAAHPGVRVVAVSLDCGKEYVTAMLEAGALGYVTKEDTWRHLLPAIYAVFAQQTYLSPVAAAAVSDSDIGARTAVFSTRAAFAG